MHRYLLDDGTVLALEYIIPEGDKVVTCMECGEINIITNFFEECYNCGHELYEVDVISASLIAEDSDNASCID